jgi:hypothetical protein
MVLLTAAVLLLGWEVRRVLTWIVVAALLASILGPLVDLARRRLHLRRCPLSRAPRSFSSSFHQALLGPTGAHSLDDPSDLSCKNGIGAVPVDSWELTRNRKVVGSNPTSGSKLRVSTLQWSPCLSTVNDCVDLGTQIDHPDPLIAILVGMGSPRASRSPLGPS